MAGSPAAAPAISLTIAVAPDQSIEAVVAALTGQLAVESVSRAYPDGSGGQRVFVTARGLAAGGAAPVALPKPARRARKPSVRRPGGEPATMTVPQAAAG